MRLLITTTLSVFILVCSGAHKVVANDAPKSLPEKLVGEHVWAVDSENSSVTFTATQAGAKFQGRFNRFDLQVRLNPEDLSSAEIHAVIDIASVDANDFDRNSTIPAKNWFDTKTFPKAAFRSTDIRQTGQETYEASGMLTIKGVSKPLVLPFTLYVDNDNALATGKVKLDRTDYNIGSGEFADEEWVGYGVNVRVNISAAR